MNADFLDWLTRYQTSLYTLLQTKNRKYGNSALSPIRVFSKCSQVEQILVRLDDKISRLVNSQIDEDEDIITDLIGYLYLLKYALETEKENKKLDEYGL